MADSPLVAAVRNGGIKQPTAGPATSDNSAPEKVFAKDKSAKFTAADNADRKWWALGECAAISLPVPVITGIVGYLTDSLVPLELIFGLPGWVVASAMAFANQRKNYRFQVPEKTQKLLVGPGTTHLVGPGHWWKYRAEDMKDNDNTFFTGQGDPFDLVENVEGGDSGNFVNMPGSFIFVIVDGEKYNGLGGNPADKVKRTVKSDFSAFCRECVKGPDGKRLETDDIIDDEERIRKEFADYFTAKNTDYLSGFGVELMMSSTKLEGIDYDNETKDLRRSAAAKVRTARAERERQDIITDGVEDKRLALAADGGSPQVSVAATEFGVHITGDPEIAGVLGQAVRNPALVAAAAGKITGKKGK